MFAAASLLTTSLILAAAPIQGGTVLTYQGSFEPFRGDPRDKGKEFELKAAVIQTGDEPTEVLWTLHEKGHGGWSWVRQFGRLPLSSDAPATPPSAEPTLAYDRDPGFSYVSLGPLRLPANRSLKEGTSWKQGKRDYRVVARESRRGFEAVRIDGNSPYGRHQSLWVEPTSRMVVALEETVFIGQGERHQLRWEVTSAAKLTDDEAKRLEATFDRALNLRRELGVDINQRVVQWNSAQIIKLREALPDLVALQPEGLLTPVLKAAAGDAKEQKGRDNAVAAITKGFVGKPAPAFVLQERTGKQVTNKTLQGKVTVLHFWSYKSSPLEEPYGQVGYLDFLLRKTKSDNLQVFGVCVDQGYMDESTRGQVMVSAQKLKSFMNLSYPILFDDGKVLKAFGDPRIAGAKLPLYVVIDSNGSVSHYHAGLYEVDRARGLKELAEVVTGLLQKAE